MSINLINDFSKIYSEQISVASRARNAVADNRLDVEQEKTNASMDKLRKQNRRFDRALASDAARKVERDVKKSSAYGPQRPKPGTVTGRRIEDPKPTGSKPTGYRTESAVPGKPAERLGAVTAIPKSEQEAARERILAKTKAKRESMKEERDDEPGEGARQKYGDMRGLDRSGAPTSFGGKWQSDERKKSGATSLSKLRKEALDPVGQEDADIDNDGDIDKSDKYLHNRRKAIGKAISKSRKKNVKEGFSNWREDLSEVVKDIEDNRQIKEKKVNNKVKTSAMGGGIKLGEAVEEIGGTLLEMVEIDEVDFIVESVYDELLEEGYDEDDIEEAIEYALIEATVTYGHDTDKPYQHKKKTGAGQLVSAVGRLARQKLSSKVRGAKASAKAAVARGARKIAKGALGVARKMEGDDNKANPRSKGAKPTSAPKRPPSAAGTREKVSSGSYQAPATTKKKAEKPSDPWEGSATTPPKAKTKKTAAPKAKATAAPKRKKKSKLDSLLADIRNEEVQIDEKALSKQQQKFMGMVYAVKKGDMKAPSPEVAKAASGMTTQQAKDFAKTKHKGLPQVKEEMDDSTEISSTSSVDNKKMDSQKKKIQLQKIRDLTTRLTAARKGIY